MAGTTALAQRMEVPPSSVSDMLRRLAGKGLVAHQKYKGVSLSEEGRLMALKVLRSHRLWEVFLVEKLHYGWEEVHALAGRLGQTHDEDLTARMDQFLGHPKFDPHGDPIPDANGHVQRHPFSQILAEAPMHQPLKIIGVIDSSPEFLKYLESRNLTLGAEMAVSERFDFDGSLHLKLNTTSLTISHQVAQNILITICQDPS